jgi:UDP-N-acetylglucosamine--N-acetylmuramyl-(pentapeptide) pyrophosphoryl-undecaprenol N-acetylglucosamine transferase
MELALAVADLAVSRAGASTVAELEALGIPAVLVPYAVGNGEQEVNARDALEAGGAILVADAAFDPGYVRDELPPLLADRARIAHMAASMASIGRRDGAERMADLVAEALASGRRD